MATAEVEYAAMSGADLQDLAVGLTTLHTTLGTLQTDVDTFVNSKLPTLTNSISIPISDALAFVTNIETKASRAALLTAWLKLVNTRLSTKSQGTGTRTDDGWRAQAIAKSVTYSAAFCVLADALLGLTHADAVLTGSDADSGV